jgi:aminoglycoside phosphotransferase (APT) family kinase protein
MTEAPTASDLRERARSLGPFLSERLGRRAVVDNVRLAGEGMSDVTLLVGLEDGEDLVLRGHKGVVGDPDKSALRRQYLFLRALEPTPVPAPRAYFYELDDSVWGLPFLAVERLAGHAVVPWSREGRAFLRRIGSGPAGDELFSVLARIHDVGPADPGIAEALEGTLEPSSPEAAVARLRKRVIGWRDDPAPVFEDAFGWLEAHLPQAAETCLVHGDYRPGNLLFEADRISGVLDWEFAHLGSPLRDLAWLLAKSNRVDPTLAAEMVPAAGAVERYEAASSRRVDPATLSFWQVFVLLDNASIWIGTTRAWKAGDLNDLRVARWSYSIPRIEDLVLEALEGMAG